MAGYGRCEVQVLFVTGQQYAVRVREACGSRCWTHVLRYAGRVQQRLSQVLCA